MNFLSEHRFLARPSKGENRTSYFTRIALVIVLTVSVFSAFGILFKWRLFYSK